MTDEEQGAAPVRPDEHGRPRFVLGLTMAGAVSAGAYTAGVLDYLVRILARQERLTRPGQPGHGRGPVVVLKVMSGASAGAVCAALAVTSLVGGDGDGAEAGAGPKGRTHPYDIWVRRLRLDGADGLLGLADLAPAGRGGPAPVASALDSSSLDRAVDATLAGLSWSGWRAGWIAEDLELFLTVTNLNGVPYAVPFTGEGGKQSDVHPMMTHATVRHFRLSGLGTQDVRSEWLRVWHDDGIPLTLEPGAPISVRRPAPQAPHPSPRDEGWIALRETALASGAFPGGLAARTLRVGLDELRDGSDQPRRGGALPVNVDPTTAPLPLLGAARSAAHVAVDGGVLNNEPFEYARFTLRPAATGDEAKARGPLAPNERNPMAADRAVLMIDPFPEGAAFSEAALDDPAEAALAAVLPKVLAAMKGEARFKLDELLAAADARICSRFLMSPSRGEDLAGAAAIACGALGGFGGFFDEAFRAHDFALGRRNCQQFLRRHFTVDARHHVFGDPDGPPGRIALLAVGLEGEPDLPEPAWPAMDSARLEATLAALERRLDALAAATGRRAGAASRAALQVGWAFARRRVTAQLRRIVLTDLLRRGQVALPAPLLDAVQAAAGGGPFGACAVLAELVGPGPDLRTAAGVATAIRARSKGERWRPGRDAHRATTEDAETVGRVLDALAAHGARPFEVGVYAGLRRDGAQVRAWHHAPDRAPPFFRARASGLFGEPDSDLPQA